MYNTAYKKENEFKQTNQDSDKLDLILHHHGSVTNLLEALFNEPMKVDCMNQHFQDATQSEWSAIAENEKVLYRNIFLCGSKSDIRYLYANSIIRTDYLSNDIVKALLNKKTSIGKILEHAQLETYREIIEIKHVNSDILRAIFKTTGDVTSRTYLIYIDKIAVMRITEYYPNQLYQDSFNK